MQLARRFATLVAAASLLWPALTQADAARTRTLLLRAQDIVRLSPDAGATEQALAEQWGQFELRIKKAGFPIPAPKCQSDIILRVPAVPPNSNRRADKLGARWALFQQIARLRQDPSAEPLSIQLSLRYYIVRSAHGEPALQYCNAFVDLPM
jgi:hypothetical protein